MKLHNVFAQQIEAAQIRLDAIAASESRQHLIDALDETCIELMERARQLVRDGHPEAAVARPLAAGMSRLYERYAPGLPADLSQIVGMLKHRALTRPAVDALPSALNAILPLMLYSARSGQRDVRAGVDS